MYGNLKMFLILRRRGGQGAASGGESFNSFDLQTQVLRSEKKLLQAKSQLDHAFRKEGPNIYTCSRGPTRRD